jgi:hypothetical protein
MIYLLYKIDFGAKKDKGVVIKLICNEPMDSVSSVYEPILKKFSDYLSLMSVEPIDMDGKLEVLYYVQLSSEGKKEKLARELSEKNKGTKVVFLIGQQSVDF